MSTTLFVNGVTLTDAAWFNDVDTNTYALTAVAGTNTITGTGPTSLTAYATGHVYKFIPANSNTGATTLNISSLGAKNIFSAGAACVGNELRAGIPVLVYYDGTQLNIVGHRNYFPSAITTAAITASGLVTANAGLTVAGGNFNSRGIADGALLTTLSLTSVASQVNAFTLTGSATGSTPSLSVTGTDTNIALNVLSKGSGNINLYSDGGGVQMLQLIRTASATRYLTITPSNGGNPTIGVSAGNLAITPAIVGAGNIESNLTVLVGTAYSTGAGGQSGPNILFGNAAQLGIFWGSGAPSVSAGKGSIYLRTDGSGIADRFYVNTNGSTTWTNFVSAA